MKKLNIVIFLILATCILTSCTRTEKTYYPSGALQSIIHYRGNKETGTTTYFFESPNSVEMEVEMKHGKRNGEFNRYFENGNLDTHCIYKNDLQDGVQTTYTANGEKSEEFTFVKGKKDGPYRAYHLSGDIKIQGNFKDDLFDGDWHYFDERGIPVGDGHFSKGIGSVTFYDADGRIARTTHYVNNKKDGKDVFYTPSGSIYKTVILKQDRIVSEQVDSSMLRK